MIIVRYLVKETLKIQLAVVFILLLVFFCQKLVKIISTTIDGDTPINLMLFLISLSIPEMAQLILPLSLFFSLLINFGALHAENEITVMHACGLGRSVLVKATMVLALFTGVIAAVNVMWIGPLSLRLQNKILMEAKSNHGMSILIQGQFQQINNDKLVIFIENVKKNQFNNIFLAQIHHENSIRPSIIVANSGCLIHHKDGSLIITLNKGTRFEGTAEIRDFRITNFQNCQVIIGYQAIETNPINIDQMDINSLIRANTSCAQAELHWRITLVFTVFVIALMVIPLSMINYRQGRIISMLPAVLLYLIFFLLHTSIKSSGTKGKIDPIVWTWIVNFLYFLLAVCLNLRNTIPICSLYARFKNSKGTI